MKKVIQEKKACIVTKHRLGSDASIVHGFCRTKEQMLNLQGIAYFIQTYLVKVIRLQDI